MALMQDAQVFMAGSMARVMAAKRAHDRTANNYRGSWGKWCDLVGISRDTGDNMVRVAEQFGNIQINGQNLIDVQPLKLLYAASKASTPPEIRERVENLDITTHKQYQEAMAQLKAEREAREKAESDLAAVKHEADLDRKERDDANAAAMRYKAECDRRAAEQERVEGLLATREDQLRASQAEVARQKRIGLEMQEEVESRDERIRELQQSQTVVAGTADPEEIERRAQRCQVDRDHRKPGTAAARAAGQFRRVAGGENGGCERPDHSGRAVPGSVPGGGRCGRSGRAGGPGGPAL